MRGATSPTLHNRVEYFADGDREWTLFATEEEFDILSPLPSDIPASYRDAKAFMVLAMTLTAQQRLVADLKANTKAVVALDPQEDYIKGNEAALRDLISKVDIFMPSAEEVVRLLGTSDWSAAARAFAALGPKLVVIKLGGEGSLLFDRERERRAQGSRLFRSPTSSIRPGAGDSFCGAFMAAYLARSRRPGTRGPRRRGGGILHRRGLRRRSAVQGRPGRDASPAGRVAAVGRHWPRRAQPFSKVEKGPVRFLAGG